MFSAIEVGATGPEYLNLRVLVFMKRVWSAWKSLGKRESWMLNRRPDAPLETCFRSIVPIIKSDVGTALIATTKRTCGTDQLTRSKTRLCFEGLRFSFAALRLVFILSIFLTRAQHFLLKKPEYSLNGTKGAETYASSVASVMYVG